MSTACGAPQAEPKKSRTRTEIAKDYLRKGELPSARREVMRAIELDPNNAEAFSVMGLVDFVAAFNNTALMEVDNCLTGVDAEGLRQESEAFLQAADKSFAKATQIDPEYSEAFANRAQVAANLEDYPRAIEMGERALEVPHRLLDLSVTRANLGWARFHVGDDVGAAKDLRQALQFKPQMCLAKYRLGRVYFKREEWNKALEQFQAVVANPKCPIQEAHLFSIRTMKKLSTSDGSMNDEIVAAVDRCRALAPKSCVAAQCQAGK